VIPLGLAIRKDTSVSELAILESGDRFEIILVQMKGASARMPTQSELGRMLAVKKRYRVKEVVLFS